MNIKVRETSIRVITFWFSADKQINTGLKFSFTNLGTSDVDHEIVYTTNGMLEILGKYLTNYCM